MKQYAGLLVMASTHGLKTIDFERITIEETLKLLGSSESGLSEKEASRRLAVYGYNEVVEKRENVIVEYLKRYWGPLPWLMEITVALSYVTGRVLEAVIMLVLLVINATVGHLHARSSKKAVEELKKHLSVKASVLRDGHWSLRDARELVPGDIIFLRLGNIVPADAKILEGFVLVDQSALTGESLPVEKKTGDILFAGSIVKRGEAKCVVVNTGPRTHFGKTLELVKSAKSRSLQEKTVLAVTRYSLVAGVISLFIAATIGLWEKWSIIELANLSIVFLMSSVPVALPAVLTILQAYGARELSTRGALVTRLSASEDLAHVDVMCFDKTGTLTYNKLQVVGVDTLGIREEKVIEYALYATREESLDPLNLAVIEYAKSKGIKRQLRLLSFVPFDPSLKRSEAVVEENGRPVRVVLGEPHTVFGLCRHGEVEERFFEEKLQAASTRGFRTLAVAIGDNNTQDLRLVGFIHLLDPPRAESKSLIGELKELGVKPIMLTGDNEAVAREVARSVGLGDNVFSAKRLLQDVDVDAINGLAEVFPEDKFNIVTKLQEKGHVVAVTGDGVNDAPALSQADVGIAVENATDAAKSAASIVLVKSGLSVIVDALKLSRVIHERAVTWVLNKLVKTLQVIGVVLVAMLWYRRMALSPLDMAMLLLANDFLTMSIAMDNQTPSQRPARWNLAGIMLVALPLSIAYIVPPLIVLYIFYTNLNMGWNIAKGALLLSLIYTSQFRILQVRERRFFWSSKPCRELTMSAIVTSLVFTAMALTGLVLPKLSPLNILLVFIISSTVLALDPLKVRLSRRLL